MLIKIFSQWFLDACSIARKCTDAAVREDIREGYSFMVSEYSDKQLSDLLPKFIIGEWISTLPEVSQNILMGGKDGQSDDAGRERKLEKLLSSLGLAITAGGDSASVQREQS